LKSFGGSFQTKALSFALLLLGSLALPGFAQVPASDVRIHYYRPDGNYSGWAINTWNASTSTNTSCSGEVQNSGTDSFGIYFDVAVNPALG
jgi:pullulanase